MRQGALIALLAHVGSFVPAERCVLGPLDRIFTRIGAGDDLAGGRSTFMVEMTEAANILNNATDKSLILMDEIGRGTSTFDGLSLAWAVARHIARVNRSFTLFATHYFELTSLANEIDGMRQRASRRHRTSRRHRVPARGEGRTREPQLRPRRGAARRRAARGDRRRARIPRGAGERRLRTADAAAHNPRSRGRAAPAHTPQAQLPLEPPAPPPPDPRLLELEAALRAVSADDLDAARGAGSGLQAARAAGLTTHLPQIGRYVRHLLGIET